MCDSVCDLADEATNLERKHYEQHTEQNGVGAYQRQDGEYTRLRPGNEQDSERYREEPCEDEFARIVLSERLSLSLGIRDPPPPGS